MEPITTATIVTLVLTKAIEKNGEKITEAVWTVAGKLLAKLKEKMPLTGMKLEQVQSNPVLMESHPKDFGAEVLEGEIVEAVKDAEVLALAEAVAQAVKAEKPEWSIVENWQGINIKGGTNTVSGNTFNF
jgi:hypothetical protein